MSNPAAIVSVTGITRFVAAHPGHGFFIRLGVVFDGYQGAHTTNSWSIALVTGLQQQQGIGAHERYSHSDFATLGEAEITIDLEFFNAGENIIPAPGIQTGTVLT